MCNAIQQNGMHTGIGGEDLKAGTRGRIALKDTSHVLSQQSEKTRLEMVRSHVVKGFFHLSASMHDFRSAATDHPLQQEQQFMVGWRALGLFGEVTDVRH